MVNWYGYRTLPRCYRTHLQVARVFLTDVLWRTKEYHAHESDKICGEYRFFIDSILK